MNDNLFSDFQKIADIAKPYLHTNDWMAAIYARAGEGMSVLPLQYNKHIDTAINIHTPWCIKDKCVCKEVSEHLSTKT